MRRSSCTCRTPRRIGPCTRSKRISPSTKAHSVRAGTPSAPHDTNRRNPWACSMISGKLARVTRMRRTGMMYGTRTGKTCAWRSMRRRLTAWTKGSGRIMRRLRELGEYDDTLFMFLSDNGGCARAVPRRQRHPRAEHLFHAHGGRQAGYIGQHPRCSPRSGRHLHELRPAWAM